MRIIICGSRSIESYLAVNHAIHCSGFLSSDPNVVKTVDTIIQGGAVTGVDAIAREWARLHGYECETFEANWKEHGRRAGPMRNAEMAANADAVVAVWDGKSKGTADMIRRAITCSLFLHVETVFSQSSSAVD